MGYDGQSKCAPAAKPGVLAFQSMVLRAYPGTGVGGIGRACNIGGQSEHKEGRAWDWTVNGGVPYQRAAAESMLDWLTATDRYGNEHAMANRLGVMYMIWNRKIWGSWSGEWETYCVQKPWGCKEPGRGGGLRHPHTDHVHFSFSWDGALKRTSYWNKNMSMLSGLASAGGGYWAIGRNGAVLPAGLGYLGSQADKPVKEPVVGIAATPSGWGYWLASRNGKVKAYGDAQYRGSAKGDTKQLAGIVSTPTGNGYWLFARGGSVFGYGDAESYGGLGADSVVVTGMAATATGLGYWMVTRDGRVQPFGDAVSYGDVQDADIEVAGIVSTPSGLGYWLFTKKGRVLPFGDAQSYGGLADKPLDQDIVSMARSATGLGYWLLGERGKVKRFGDAPKVSPFSKSTLSAARPPAGPTPQTLPGD